MEFRLSKNAGDILKNSHGEAVRMNSDRIETRHILLSILRLNQCRAYLFLSQNCDCEQLKVEIEEQLRENSSDFDTVVDKDNMVLSEDAENVIKISNLESLKFHKKVVGSEDVLSAILYYRNSSAANILSNYGISYESFEKYRLGNSNKPSNTSKSSFNINFEVRQLTEEENEELKKQFPPEFLKDVSNLIEKKLSSTPDINFSKDDSRGGRDSYETTNNKNNTPLLNKFGKNLTKLAEEGNLDPVIGRNKEIEHVCRVLSRRKKNNPILIGEPGVGKSSIAEGLAIKIAQKDIPYSLANKVIYTLDMALVVAGTKYRGQFEERIKNLISELEENKNIIVFIDEIHTIAGAGNSEGGLDASNIFKPALARGEIQCIGATTIEEYRKYIEEDGALERRFQKILIEPTSAEETLEILKNIKGKYETYHNVIYSEEALKACVTLTERYMNNRNLPDKAIDVLDEAGANKQIRDCKFPEEIRNIEKTLLEAKKEKLNFAKNQEFEKASDVKNKIQALSMRLREEQMAFSEKVVNNPKYVTEQDIAFIVSQTTGISMDKLEENERKKLLEMQKILSEQVIGQNTAVEKVCQSIKRARTGLKDPNKPSGTFIFIGSTGVGKTLLAKKLAQYLFGSPESLIRIDMSEYMEKHSVSKLIGSPPGYVGYEEAGQLSEKVRTHPYSIVLFDEIEKAHTDVFNILLQILDEGRLTDASGRQIDFKNTIIIMTSNVGSRTLKDFGVGIGFSSGIQKGNLAAMEQSVIEKDLKKTFAPEFLNRIDDIVYFNTLELDDMFKIFDLEIEGLKKRLLEIKYTLTISKKAKEFVITQNEDSQYGARPIKRGIQSLIENPLSNLILESSCDEGGKINIDLDKKNNELKFSIENNDSSIEQ